MKNLMFLYLLVITTLFCYACSDDEGNYVYHEINEITTSGIDANEWYTKVAYVDHLILDPQIESSLGYNDESNYDYEWKLIPKGVDFDNIENVDGMTISNERKLDILVTQDPGEYSCFFIVKDRETGVCWTTCFNLRVRSMTNEGWLILCDDGGKSRLDIIFNETEENDMIAHDIWNGEEFNPGKPLRLIYNYHLNETVTILVTDKSSYNLDKGDLHVGEDNDLKWRFGVVPDAIHVKASAVSQYSVNNYWIIIDDKNDIYSLDRKVYGSIFEFSINSIDGTEQFVPAPFIGVNYDNSSYANGRYGCAPAVMYDETHHSFVIIRNNSSYPSVMKFSGTQLFESSNTGRNMLYMESTKSGVIYALLKDPSTGKVYYYGIDLRANYTPPKYWWETGEYEEYNLQTYYGEVNGPDIGNAEIFAFHHMYPYLFYTVGNKIYQFDMGHPENTAQEVLNFPNEEIKVMKFNPFVAWESYEDWERARGYQLIVGTNIQDDEMDDCGIMRVYDVPNLMEPLINKKEFRGLGKIVDIVYKERNKN